MEKRTLLIALMVTAVGLSAIFFAGCKSAAETICGANHVLHNRLCWSRSINNGDFKKADAMCQQYGYRLPVYNEIAAFCSAFRGLPKYDRPGADATMYWSSTPDPTSSKTNLLAVSPSCRQESAVFLNPKYFFCVKEAPPQPQQ